MALRARKVSGAFEKRPPGQWDVSHQGFSKNKEMAIAERNINAEYSYTTLNLNTKQLTELDLECVSLNNDRNPCNPCKFCLKF